MASSKSKGAGGRGPAKEIKQGDGGVGKTSAGKPRKPIKGKPSAALKVPGVVKG
jgi:hypothetical protein